MSQSELAEAIGTTQKSISRYETGRVSIPLDRAFYIAQALKCSLDDLVAKGSDGALHLSEDEERLLEYFRACEADVQDAIMLLSKCGANASNEAMRSRIEFDN